MLEQTIERWFDEATRKGMQQGMQQGMQAGVAKTVALLLQLRFGPVPGWVQERLVAATEEELTGWTAAILTASSIQDLFGPDDAKSH